MPGRDPPLIGHNYKAYIQTALHAYNKFHEVTEYEWGYDQSEIGFLVKYGRFMTTKSKFAYYWCWLLYHHPHIRSIYVGMSVATWPFVYLRARTPHTQRTTPRY